MQLYQFDRSQNIPLLCGIDEAGRGPLAGPVIAAAVILPLENEIEGINDSKKLTEKKREFLYPQIIHHAIDYGIGAANPKEIDKMNILQATFLAMRRAVQKLKVSPSLILVDGNCNPALGFHSRCIIKGDQKSANIAAASILAKVTRDRMMRRLHQRYPVYGFHQHKGYGTKAHLLAISEFGECPVHRQTFLKKFKAKHPNPSQIRGKFGGTSSLFLFITASL